MKVDGQFFESRADASRFLHPADTLFDHCALSIGRSVELDRPVMERRFVGMLGEVLFPAPAAAVAARAFAPSMHQRSQSMRLCSSSVSCKASMISAKTPSLRHFAK